ncbi:MAG: glutamine amidotransferase, partial [Pseudomonadota bacterium]
MPQKPFLILQVRPETEAADDEFVALLDKGGLAVENVVRVRLDLDPAPDAADLSDFAGIIVGGGPGCISDPPEKKTDVEALMEARALEIMPRVIADDLPFLGCCYGIGTLAHALSGDVSQARFGESVGPVTCHMTRDAADDPLCDGLPETFDAFVGHKEAVQALPPGSVHLAASETCPFQMIRYGANVYATQFHPEADAAVFETRIRLYRNKGYFPPDEADALIARCNAADVTIPERILARLDPPIACDEAGQ